MEKISNWGLFPSINAEIIEPSDFSALTNIIKNETILIPRGNGRCYGDSALQNTLISTLKFNKIIAFDKQNGKITCESGVLLSEVLDVIVPHRFFLPVTPGTKFITVGGAIASNIHGKNNHKEGSFSSYVESFELINEKGELLFCSKNSNPNLFKNTMGGMGLTGIITVVTFYLKKIETSFIKQKSIKAPNLDAIIDYFEKYSHFTYSVAWIDCVTRGSAMGRSLLLLGEHATQAETNGSDIKASLQLHSNKQINIPFYFPSFTLNWYTIKAFNILYYNKQLAKEKDNFVHYNSFFYPLDKLGNWNRLYGKNGFTQYQFVLPFEKGREGLKKIMKKITESGCASFLAVLKTFGAADNYSSPISFPTSGYTLALDFKINKKVFSLLDELDRLVLEYGGKIYLTKDARMSKEMYTKTYPKFEHPEKFNSLQSQRLEI